MGYYRTCPHCGAHLDPGEVCDCVAASTPLTTSDVEYATGVYRQKIYADLYAGLLIGTKPDGKHWSIQAMDCLEWARYL